MLCDKFLKVQEIPVIDEKLFSVLRVIDNTLWIDITNRSQVFLEFFFIA